MVAIAAAAEGADCTVPEAAVAKPEDNTPVVIALLALTSADADIEDVALIVPDALEAVLPIVDFRWLLELAELDTATGELAVGEAWVTGAITMQQGMHWSPMEMS
jgi:hypothetical protein